MPHIPRALFIVLAFLACLTARLAAQTDPPPMPPGFWEWWRATYRADAGGVIHADDGAPPFPGGGSGGGTPGPLWWNPVAPGTNLWLFITQDQSNQTVVITLSNTFPGSNYLLLASSNLAGPWVTNQSLVAPAGTVTVAAPIVMYDEQGFFFAAKQGAPPVPGAVKWIAPISTSGYDNFEGSGLDCSPAFTSAMGKPLILITIGNNVTPSNCMIFAADPIVGGVQWSQPIFQLSLTNTVEFQPGEMTGSAAVAPDGMIYVGGLDGNLYSLFPDGSTNWARPAGNIDSIYSTPAVGSNGIIYVTSDEAPPNLPRPTNLVTGVTAFNPDGTTNWFFQPQDLYYNNFGDVDSSPVVGADGSIYFLAEGFRLYCLTADSHLKWFLTLPGDAEPASTPALAPNGTIVVGSGYLDPNPKDSPYVYDVNPDGSLNWVFNVAKYGGGNIIQSSPTVDQNGVIYVGSATLFQEHVGCVFAINPDGTPKWIFTNSGNFVTGSPAVAADGTVYVGDEGGYFYAISNGVAAWTFATSGSASIIGSPVILPDGSVVFGAEDGNLYCFWGTVPPATNAPWPMFQHDAAHSGQQPPPTFTNSFNDCGAPFVFNGSYDGVGNFSFSMTGVPGSNHWNVYATTDLSNWTQVGTNLTMDSVTGNASFTDSNVTGLSQQFYKVATNGCCSKAIGFVNVTIAPSNNLTSDPLYQVDDNVLNEEVNNSSIIQPMNSLNALFAVSNAWGTAQSGTTISKWNGTGFDGDTNGGTEAVVWVGIGDLTMLPGSSVLMSNATSVPFTNTFVGLIREEQVFQIQRGTNSYSTNYLSASIPVAGYITNITGYVPRNGDTIELWNTTNQIFDPYEYTSGAWSPGSPGVRIGEGFVLITTNTYSWTNSWQQCP
jgi:hypothetical protein